MRTSPHFTLFALALALVARVASADPAAADKLAAQAQQQYADGHYLDAAATFRSAYAQDPKPGYLFNIAQAYRFAKSCGPAADYYRKFIDAVHDAPNLDKVRRYLADMDACARTTDTTSSTNTASTSPGASSTSSTGTAGTNTAGGASTGTTATDSLGAPAAAPTDQPDPGRTKRYTGIAVGVVGIAALVVGVHYQQVVNDTENQQNALNDQCKATPAPANTACSGSAFQSLEDRGHRASTLSITSYTVGSAAIIGGVALYFLGRSETASSAVVHTLVTPTPGGAIMGARFRF